MHNPFERLDRTSVCIHSMHNVKGKPKSTCCIAARRALVSAASRAAAPPPTKRSGAVHITVVGIVPDSGSFVAT